MTAPAQMHLSDIIKWEFVVAEQTMQSRYGQSNGMYFKQFMPNGRVLDSIHPPRKIDKAQYEFARKHAKE